MEPVEVRARSVGLLQDGLATRAQLTGVAVSQRTVARRIAAGVWAEPLPTVIDLGTHAPSWRKGLRQILLAAGPEAWACRWTAAYLHGLLDVGRPRHHDVLVPRRRHPRVGDVRLRTAVTLSDGDVTKVGSVAVTSIARTLLDLATITPQERYEPLVWEAVRTDRGLPTVIATTLVAHPHAPGRATLERTLSELHPELARAESPLEMRGLLGLRRVGAPEPRLQLTVRDAAGRFVARVDAAWPGARVIVEFDGAAYHATPAQRARDAARRERLRALGWHVITLRAADLVDGRLREVAAEIHARGGG